jgi:pyridoxamine 5'-phosphate oxidase
MPQEAGDPDRISETLRALPVFVGVGAPPFDPNALPEEPLLAAREWLLAAIEAGEREPHALHLSTVSAAGIPSSRVLICKDLDAEQLSFATDALSRKGRELTAHAVAAAHFYWPTLGRQVRLVGAVTRASRTDSQADFASRPRSGQLLALAHEHGPLESAATVQRAVDALGERYPGTPPCPPTWTLYRMRPTEVELWQASPDRQHHRVLYRRGPDGWAHAMLWP